MQIKLRAVHGKFRDQRGDADSAANEITVTRKRFVIGSGKTCHMCCQSRSVSELHCQLIQDERGARVRDLGSDSGTFVNDERIGDFRDLVTGDRLRVGKLEFEIVLEATPTERSVLHPVQGDAVDKLVSDLLVKADALEREQRLHDPNARVFKTETPPHPDAAEIASAEAAERKRVPPAHKPPGKLPARPNIQGKDTVDAAQQALQQLFDQGKKKHEP